MEKKGRGGQQHSPCLLVEQSVFLFWQPSNHNFFLSAVLWHEGDELLYGAVRCISGPWCSFTAHLEPGTQLPARETQIHEHRWADGARGRQVWLKQRMRWGRLKPTSYQGNGRDNMTFCWGVFFVVQRALKRFFHRGSHHHIFRLFMGYILLKRYLFPCPTNYLNII